MKIKCILFNIEDVLYNSTLQMSTARMNAIRAMIETGLPTDIETTYRVLEEIVKEYGPDYSKHFDELLKRLGLRWDPRVIASGVIAYRETSAAYLKPYPDTVPTLLKLRDLGYKLGVVSEGRAVKQWQKLVQLGVQHIFHLVIVSEELGLKTLDSSLFKAALEKLNGQPEETIFIGSQLEPDIACANEVGIISVRIRRGEHRIETPETAEATPKYEIDKLSEIFSVIKEIETVR
ncbi:MAG: HAD family hydrolase [Candidatus Bathyarchaeia archaeon]